MVSRMNLSESGWFLLFICDSKNYIYTLNVHCVKPAVKKKKSVRFGTPLSPEVFDKTLPPSTPLRKGGTPAQTPTPGGGLKLRSALKTPQTSDSNGPGADPCSPSMMGASPPLVRLGRKSEAADGEEEEVVDWLLAFSLPALQISGWIQCGRRLCWFFEFFLFECFQIVFPSTQETDSEAPDAGLTSILHPLELQPL